VCVATLHINSERSAHGAVPCTENSQLPSVRHFVRKYFATFHILSVKLYCWEASYTYKTQSNSTENLMWVFIPSAADVSFSLQACSQAAVSVCLSVCALCTLPGLPVLSCSQPVRHPPVTAVVPTVEQCQEGLFSGTTTFLANVPRLKANHICQDED
jgi:hypothetical protein